MNYSLMSRMLAVKLLVKRIRPLISLDSVLLHHGYKRR